MSGISPKLKKPAKELRWLLIKQQLSIGECNLNQLFLKSIQEELKMLSKPVKKQHSEFGLHQFAGCGFHQKTCGFQNGWLLRWALYLNLMRG